MGRGFPIPSRPNTFVNYQTTHIGYDLQGEPTFADHPILQTSEDDYQVTHVGFHIYGDPLCEDVSAIYMINHYHLLVMILDIHPD